MREPSLHRGGRLAAAGVAILAVAACTVGPNYQAPAVPLDPGFVNAATGNAKAPASGNNTYIDHGPDMFLNAKMPTVLAVICSENDTHGTIYAVTRSGDVARIDVQDLGEPGRNDTYSIVIDTGYASGERALDQGGNIQIHHH